MVPVISRKQATRGFRPTAGVLSTLIFETLDVIEHSLNVSYSAPVVNAGPTFPILTTNHFQHPAFLHSFTLGS